MSRITSSAPSESNQDLGHLLRQSVYLSEKVDAEREYLVRRAPNVIEWLTRSEYCNQPSIFQHWGAYKLIRNFFEVRCPTPECNKRVPADPWGLSPETLQSETLLQWSPRVDDDQCPRCHVTRAEFVERGMFNNYRNMIAVLGQRSGKSSTLALLATYIEHVLLTIAHTHKDGLFGYFGVPPGDRFDMSFVASTDTQSKDTIWAKFRGYRALSPWFKRYVPWIKLQEKLQTTPKGMQKWSYTEEADKKIENGCINLYLDSLNSNSNGLAGRTRVGAFIDEICRMEQTDSSRSAKEVYRTMDASTQTVQARVDQYGLVPWLGMIGSISSPISVDDYGMQLLDMAKDDRRMYAVRMATWDFNPWEPKSAYEDRLRKDYVGTMRNFGACPPGAANPLIDRPDDFVKSAVDAGLKPTVEFEYYDHVDRTGRNYAAVKVTKADLILYGAPRFIAVDAGKNFDAFCVACAHGEVSAEGELVTVMDWSVRILTRDRSQEVLFDSLYEMIRILKDRMIINQIEFDHWNSTYLTQRIRDDFGVRAEEVKTDDKHFIQFARDAYSGKVRLLPPTDQDARLDPPYKSAPAAGIYELLKLERDPKNDKVSNPLKGKRAGYNSDDMARVMVHVHRLVQDQGYTERQDDTSRRARRKRSEAGLAEWSAARRGGLLPSKLKW